MNLFCYLRMAQLIQNIFLKLTYILFFNKPIRYVLQKVTHLSRPLWIDSIGLLNIPAPLFLLTPKKESSKVEKLKQPYPR